MRAALCHHCNVILPHEVIVTWPFDSHWALSYRLPIYNNPLFPLISKILSLKDADTHTYIHTHTDIHVG